MITIIIVAVVLGLIIAASHQIMKESKDESLIQVQVPKYEPQMSDHPHMDDYYVPVPDDSIFAATPTFEEQHTFGKNYEIPIPPPKPKKKTTPKKKPTTTSKPKMDAKKKKVTTKKKNA